MFVGQEGLAFYYSRLKGEPDMARSDGVDHLFKTQMFNNITFWAINRWSLSLHHAYTSGKGWTSLSRTSVWSTLSWAFRLQAVPGSYSWHNN